MLDISPRLERKALKRAVNNTLHSLWLTEDQLAEAVARHPRAPGAKRVAKLIGLAGHPDPVRLGGRLPGVLHRVRVAGAGHGRAASLGYIVDALFVAERVIVELDSREFHMDPIAFEDRSRARRRDAGARLRDRPGDLGADRRATAARRRSGCTRSSPTTGGHAPKRGVDDLIGAHRVLGLLGLAQRGVVDPRRHRVDEPPLQDRAADRARPDPRCTGTDRTPAARRQTRSHTAATPAQARGSP